MKSNPMKRNLPNTRTFILALLFSSLGILPAISQDAAKPAADTAKKAKKPKDPNDSTKKIKLFKESAPLQMTILTDMRQLVGEKDKAEFQKATISLKLPDNTEYKETIELRARGNFRREYCYVPSLMLNFEATPDGKLSSLEKLKMVSSCRLGKVYDGYVLREYLCYKMWNILTPMSFRVRLMQINFTDSEGKRKPYSSYGFFIEDVDDMAKRNGCREMEIKKLHTERTNRNFMTMVAMFQYMIGNTDWSVPGDHNIKLIQVRDSATTLPYAIPYDFDYSGLVNAEYAVPDEQLGTTSVRERVYRGFPRTTEEIAAACQMYLSKKQEIYDLVRNFETLDKKDKDDIIRFLDEFYKVVSDPARAKREFIDNARSL
jgi:hypothetical protein